MRRLFMACAVAALVGGCSPSDDGTQKAEQTAAAPVDAPARAATEAPSGDYTLDKAHASLIFRVNHVGFSNYTAQFMDFDAALKLDTKNPGASSVTATIDPMSLMINTPPAGFLDKLLGEKWLDAATFPQMTFRSSRVEMTGANTARVTGELALRSATKPVTLDVTFNGGYAGHPFEPQARIGFSARGTLNRSDFGVSEGIPPPGSTIGVGDAVEIVIEAEFNGRPLKAPPPAP